MTGDPQEQERFSYAIVAAVLALAMWSGTAIANKIAVEYMSGMSAGVLRSVLAGSVALMIVLAFRMPIPKDGKNRTLLAISGLASFAIWPTLLGMGIERTTATHAAIIMAMIPIFTVLIQNAVDKGIPEPGWWLGAVIAFAATCFLVVEQNSAAASTDASIRGDLIVLAGCLVCASGYVAGGRVSKELGSVATTFWGLAIAMILLVPVFAAIATDTTWSSVPPKGWIAIGWMTVLSSLAGYGLWFYALAQGGIARIGSLQLAMPVTTIIAAALVLGEVITLKIAAVTMVIVAGTLLAHRQASQT